MLSQDDILDLLGEQENMMDYAPQEFKRDKDFAKRALSVNGRTLRYFDKEITSDLELVEIAINKDFSSYGFIDETLKDNKYLALETIRISRGNQKIFNMLSKNLKNDLLVVSATLNQNPDLELDDEMKKNFI
jgi:hypothetical protein